MAAMPPVIGAPDPREPNLARLIGGRWNPLAAAGRSSHLLPAAFMVVLSALVGILAGHAPILALAGAIAVGYTVLLFANLTIGVAVFTTLVFTETLLPAGAALSLVKVVGALLACSWFARVSTGGVNRVGALSGANPVGSGLLLAFLGWLALSIAWAGDAGVALDSFSRYLLNAVLFVIVFTAVQTRRQMGWVVGAYLLGVVITAVYGLIARPEHTAGEAFRLAGSVGNSNELAAVLVTGIALALATAAAVRSNALRSAAFAAVVLAMISLILTGSRGGLLALAAAILAAVVFAGRWRPQVLAVSLALALTGVTSFAAFAPQEIRDRLSRLDPAQTNIAEEGRATLWQVGWRIVEDHPIAGVGIGNFQDASGAYVLLPGQTARTDQVIDRNQGPHNMYLGMLAEVGTVGLLLFISVLAFATSAAAMAARRFERAGDIRMEIVARAVVVALVGACVAGFFSTHDVSKWMWVLLALGPSLLTISRTAPTEGGANEINASGHAEAFATQVYAPAASVR